MTEENTRRRITGHRKLRLIRELAKGDKTQQTLGREYGVTSRAIAGFAVTNAEAIAQCLADIDDAFKGLWIADQVNRIAEYEAMAERLDEIIYDSSNSPSIVGTAIQKKTIVLRNVAEERGHLLQKIEASGQYNYAVEGVDMSKLGGK